MKSFDNSGRLVNEMNTSYTSDGRVVTTNTTYYSPLERVSSQHVTIRDKDGKVRTTDIVNGKLLP